MDYYRYPHVNGSYYQADNDSVAESNTDLYPHEHYRRGNGRKIKQKRERRGRRNSDRTLMDQSYYHQTTMHDEAYARPTFMKNSYNRRHSSYDEIVEPNFSPNNPYYHHPSYQDEHSHFNKNRDKQHTKTSYQEYPVTPEEERNSSGFLFLNDSQGETGIEQKDNKDHFDIDAYDVPYQIQDMDDDEDSFIEDTTTQRNTLINAESAMAIGHNDDLPPLYQQPLTPPAEQKQDLPSPITEKKKWYKSIISTTALVLKKKLGKEDSAKQKATPLQSLSSPAIQVISATNNELLGDVLDSQQQKEILSQLSSPQPSLNHPLSPEKTKITSLSRIWVFRLIEEGFVPENIAWIGFDFENQLKIEQHTKDLESRAEDGRLAIYDSHIRHKTMPVIVTPNENKGYYFADIHQNELITLEVTFIENHHQKVTFVYRV